MKTLAQILAFLVLVLACTTGYFYYQLRETERITNDKVYYYEGGIASLKTKIASQDKLIDMLQNTVLADIVKDDTITSSTTISGSVKTKNQKDNKPDYQYEDKYKFYEVRFADGPPIGYVMVYPDGSYVSKIYDHEIIINNVLSKDKSGKLKSYASVSLVLKKSGLANRRDSKLKDWKNIPYPLKVVDGQTVYNKDEVDMKKLRFTVRPNLNGTVRTSMKGKIEVAPSIGASFIAYGTKERPVWKFANVAVGYNSKVFIEAIPVMRKIIGRNTYVGPSISIDEDLDLKAGATVSLEF